jgi:hypothetical protein
LVSLELEATRESLSSKLAKNHADVLGMKIADSDNLIEIMK